MDCYDEVNVGNFTPILSVLHSESEVLVQYGSSSKNVTVLLP